MPSPVRDSEWEKVADRPDEGFFLATCDSPESPHWRILGTAPELVQEVARPERTGES